MLAILVGYVASQGVLAWWLARKPGSDSDFLLAGRRLGPWLGTFSVFATWFGAETCVGAAAQAYQEGLPGVLADPLGCTLGLVAMALFLAGPLWRRNLTTYADLFRQRFGARVETLAALLMVPTSMLWAAAQLRALGQVVVEAGGPGMEAFLVPSILGAAAVVLAYTVLGGMQAGALADLVQGLVLVAGVAALGGVFWHVHAPAVTAAVHRAGPMLDHYARAHPWAVADTLSAQICAAMAGQELVSRILAVKSPAVARSSTLAAAGLYLLVGAIPVLLGLAAVNLYGGAGFDPERLLARTAAGLLPGWAYALFLCALVSAILSTVSGALLVAGGLLAHNLWLPRHPEASARARLLATRLMVLLVGLVACGVGMAASSVYNLVKEAGALGSSGLLVIALGALWGPRWLTSTGAMVAMFLGVGIYLAGRHLWGWSAPYLSSLGLAAIGLVGTSLIQARTRSAAGRPPVARPG